MSFSKFSAHVWAPSRWERGAPKASTIAAYRRDLRCAASSGHRIAMRVTWRRDRRRYFAHRQVQLARLNIDHIWSAHWAPDYSGPMLPPYVIAALAEEAGKVLGVDVPGWTMEQVTLGESGGRPGSAGVDVGGTTGWGLWAITDPFANPILARYGWTYEDMLDPVRCAVAMAEVYASQGIGAWYGTSHVTSTDAHYRGKLDLSLYLGGVSFRRALRR